MVDKPVSEEGKLKSARKPRVKATYMFPAYDLGSALQLARKVDSDGGGSLTEETLAINLGVSAKSSGYRLKCLAARQFGLLSKQRERLTTTSLTQAILKPTSDEEKANALKEAFTKIPLFSAVATKYKGQPLPQGETFRNILDREFRIERDRVIAAERVLMDSAREASVLVISGSNTYLSTERMAIERKEPEPAGTEVPVTPTPPPGKPLERENVPAKAPSDDELRRLYVQKLIEQVSRSDTSGKDAQAIKAEADLRKAELDRIERLIGITNKKEDKN